MMPKSPSIFAKAASTANCFEILLSSLHIERIAGVEKLFCNNMESKTLVIESPYNSALSGVPLYSEFTKERTLS